MKITPFAVEQWMNEFETMCRYNLAETCVASLTIQELLNLAGQRDSLLKELLPLKLTYGDIKGSSRLRSAIAALFTQRGPEEVLITHGAIGANALVYQALVGAGDQVISVVPTYQQHYSIPESLGAEVRRLHLRAENAFLPDLAELKRLVTPKTKLIAFTNPNNPTGSLMDRGCLDEIVALADSVGAYILSDEVYRGTDQESDSLGASVADLYARGISVGSMSKAFSLAGVRLGWICGPAEVLSAAEVHRDYNTISVGMVDDLLASIALEHQDKILKRSRHIVRENLGELDRWVAAESAISYVKPKAGTVCLLKYQGDMPSREFCVRLIQETGVLFTPGSTFEEEGTVRIGYANNHEVLKGGLEATSRFLRTLQ
ncbi:MAG TPA: aminotransferase [Steroidobacteraceae bacterium]|jgi:aspartate/methionine/tyrosine aminotransferase